MAELPDSARQPPVHAPPTSGNIDATLKEECQSVGLNILPFGMAECATGRLE